MRVYNVEECKLPLGRPSCCNSSERGAESISYRVALDSMNVNTDIAAFTSLVSDRKNNTNNITHTA